MPKLVGDFPAALVLAGTSALIAGVPERHTVHLRAGMHSFPLPVPTPQVMASLLWHPRLHAGPVHPRLRGLILDACATGR